MMKSTLLAFKALLFLASTCIAISDSVITLSTTSQCVVFYDTEIGRNATQIIPQDQLPKTSITLTSRAGLVKTAVLTPRPYTTILDSTSIFYEVTSLVRGDYRAYTSYTSTLTVEITRWGTSTTTTTKQETLSLAATLTIPAASGYTPLAVKDKSAQQKFIAESDDRWELQDEYWDVDKGNYFQEAICNRGFYPTAVTCYVIIYTADFYSTATLRRSIPQQTYTRTRYVSTETWTRTVNVYPTPGNPNATITTNLYTTITHSAHTEVVTSTETATVEVYPSTTTVYAACATDNVINSYNVLGYDDIVHSYAFDALRLVNAAQNSSIFDIKSPNVTSALHCCTHTATEPNTWFYRYQDGKCTIWIRKDCLTTKNTTRPTAELWWSAQTMDNIWRDDSMVVGNGACGGIDVIRPYWFRD